jgi:AcrR family transcriptional regulator
VAAADTFDELGYTGTRMTDIAQRAGMSVESVYATGSKPTLLMEAFKQRYAGESGWGSIVEASTAQDIFALTDADEALDAWMRFLLRANRDASGLWRALQSAAPAEPAVAALLEEHWTFRRESFAETVRWMGRIGLVDPAPPETSVALLAAEISTVTSFEVYEQLVHRWGWSPEQYEAWVRSAVTAWRA